MYTAYIGRRLLDLYNRERRDGPPLTPRAFFDDVFFPLFFDDERYLMLANNSKFDQKYKQKKSALQAERREALADFHAATTILEEPHGHLYLGGYDQGVTGYTSGQVTDISIPVSADEVYLSWFGTAASVGVEGGLTLLVDADEVLLALLDGWAQYRAYMRQTPPLKPHQFTSWNGWWIIHRFDEGFDGADPLRNFPLGAPGEPQEKKGSVEFGTPPWVRVLFALAGVEEARRQTVYVYRLSYRGNTTVGFVPFDLPEVRRLTQFYEHLFGHRPEFVGRRQFIRMYEPAYRFQRACEMGSIGLRALEPRHLHNFMPVRDSKNRLPRPPSGKKQHEQEITFAIYLTWIIAMLNNEDLLAFAEKTAEALRAYATSDARGKMTNHRAAEGVLASTHRRAFIDGLTEILKKDGTHAETFDRLVTEVVKMPSNDFPLLLTLIRFKYALQDHRAVA